MGLSRQKKKTNSDTKSKILEAYNLRLTNDKVCCRESKTEPYFTTLWSVSVEGESLGSVLTKTAI